MSETQSKKCEGPLSENEIFSCLKTFSSDKSPGTDGLTSEWYNTFWPEIKDILIDSFNYTRENGKLGITQRQGIITLIPKKEKDPLLIKNWRPISLLNLDYKLIAKCIANRIKTVLPFIIHNDQTGFMSGRYIGENLIRAIALINYSQKHNLNTYLATIDFQKAFDFLENAHIFRCLRYFGFGQDILTWIKILYHDVSSCVINNGFFTEFFKIERGVRQGCPLSPYIFVLSVECLAHFIRNNPIIKGIEVDGVKHVISQYADDTVLFLAADPISLKEIVQTFETFSSISGLVINKQKTEFMPMRNHKVGMTDLIQLGLSWTNGPVSLLGVHMFQNMSDTCDFNYKLKPDKIRQIIYAWEHRKLTLLGKVVVLKAHILSQLIYILSVLPSPNSQYLKEVEKIIFKFIWSGGNDKIQRDIICSPKHLGGLNMMNITLQAKALKIMWVKRLGSGSTANGWRHLIDNQFNNTSVFIFKCNLAPQRYFTSKI